jgi:PRC-barrel domain protein
MADFDFPPPLVEGHQHRGAGVFDGKGKRIGTIDRVFAEPSSARVVYADLTCGGILGFGARYYGIAWDKLHADPARGGFRMDAADVQELRRGDKPGVSSGRLLHGRW